MNRKPMRINQENLRMKRESSKMQRECKGCYYYSGWNCDYILFEKNAGHARLGINAR